jgi:hypothetical protein
MKLLASVVLWRVVVALLSLAVLVATGISYVGAH